MKHEILFLGKTKDKFLSDGIGDYHSRLKHYTNFKISVIKDTSGTKGRNNKKLRQSELLMKAVPPGAFKVVLDATGRQFTSEAFAKRIQKWEVDGVKQVVYLIGGPEGHSPHLLEIADLQLSLSKMTFTHDMVRLLLVEQIYRAYTIKAGEKYHK